MRASRSFSQIKPPALLLRERQPCFLDIIDGLEKLAWKSQIEKKQCIGMLRKYERAGGTEFLSSLGAKEYEDSFIEVFGRSVDDLVPKLVKRAMPRNLVIEIVDEYLKFFVIQREEINISSNQTFSFHSHASANIKMCITFPQWMEREGEEVKSKLLELRRRVAHEGWIVTKNGAYNLMCDLQDDPFFTSAFKSMILKKYLNRMSNLSSDQRRKIRRRPARDMNALIKAKYSFAKYAKSRSVTQWRKNLIYSYFYVLLTYFRENRGDVKVIYEVAALEKVLEIFRRHYRDVGPERLTDPDVNCAYGLDRKSLRSLINDFCKEYRKRPASSDKTL